MVVMKYNDMVIYFFPTEYIRHPSRVGDTSFRKRKKEKQPAAQPLRLIVSLKPSRMNKFAGYHQIENILS